MKNPLRVVLLGTLLACPVLGYSETSGSSTDGVMAEKPAVPSIGAIMGASGITVTGYLDASYTYLSGDGAFTGVGIKNRVFDRERDSFNIQMLDLTVSSLPSDGFGGLANLSVGEDANVIAPLGTGSDDEFDIQAAYLHYASGPLMVIAGKYVTLSGAEVIKSTGNANFSRSILFGYAIPFTHTGMRATYAVNDHVALIAGVNNGWDVLKESDPLNQGADGKTADGKTVELGLSAMPLDALSLAVSVYSGDEGGGAVVGRRTLYDVVATYNATDALSFTVNYDYATQKDAMAVGDDAKWSGVAGYVNYKFNDQWRTSLRAETFDDTDGFRTGTPTAQTWKEVTATLAYMPYEHVELRAELRGDRSDKDVFEQTSGAAKDNQDSIGLEAIYKF